MSNICNKCSNRELAFLKVHSCLHSSSCIEKDLGPAPRSIIWNPVKCSICTLWVAKLRDESFNNPEDLYFVSFLREIFKTRRKSGVPADRQWNFFPDEDLASRASIFLESGGCLQLN